MGQLHLPVWEAWRLSPPEIRRVVADAETRQLGILGYDDLYLVISQLACERHYCHEADVHLNSENPSPYTESVKRDWVTRGWNVRERTGDTWRDVSA